MRWEGAVFVSLQEASRDAESDLEIPSCALTGDQVSHMEARPYTRTAHGDVQNGKLRKITANHQLVGFVSANAAPGDILVDLRGHLAHWPWIVVRLDQHGILQTVCFAWLMGGFTLFKPSTTESFNSDANVAALLRCAGSIVHGACSLNLSPEDLLVLAASVNSISVPQPSEMLAQLAAKDGPAHVNAGDHIHFSVSPISLGCAVYSYASVESTQSSAEVEAVHATSSSRTKPGNEEA